jgi:hypothetical protein
MSVSETDNLATGAVVPSTMLMLFLKGFGRTINRSPNVQISVN